MAEKERAAELNPSVVLRRAVTPPLCVVTPWNVSPEHNKFTSRTAAEDVFLSIITSVVINMTTPRHEFLSLDEGTIPSDDDSMPGPIQTEIDTLFAEFTRTRRRLSPRPLARARIAIPEDLDSDDEDTSKVDLRALDYVSEYDSHLMCPICHVPFVEPIVLDCDHTFCTACFKEYRTGASHSERSQCPTCRAYLLARPHKASRLIANMCSDLKVRCPNEDCDQVVPRGCIEQHVSKDCPETRLDCPDSKCQKMVKRKNFVPNQCIHSSHIECDCGAIIELGRGEWLKHKDEDCPTTGVKCDRCDERISVKDYLAGRNTHVCKADDIAQQCPGAEYGCIDDLVDCNLDTHTRTCPLARLAPTLKKQAQLLQSLEEQLTITKVRNEVLETGIDQINVLINDRILPNLLSTPASDHDYLDNDTDDIEEIQRQPPSPLHGPPTSLSLPAHLRPLTPTNSDLFSLHSNLQDNISTLSSQVMNLQNALSELDARTSMTVMNETLRLKDELAHQSAGLFSSRAQVQWLLQRERERMVHAQHLHQQQIHAQMQQRGRQGQPGEDANGVAATGTSPGSASSTDLRSARSSVSADFGGAEEGVSLPSSMSAAMHNAFPAPTAGPSSSSATGTVGPDRTPRAGAAGPSAQTPRSPPTRSTTLPMTIPGMGVGIGMGSPRVRPQLRRLSGGSQERVKL